ncbi:MAG: hypothetical protein ACTHLN_05870 [Tepidisphaeraceae bacterium]
MHDLLRRAEPPSIGIACFNMVQRDLITETLAEWADNDAEFAAKLAGARERRGQGSSEGLFVKNLENVQGDERDHLIITRLRINAISIVVFGCAVWRGRA